MKKYHLFAVLIFISLSFSIQQTQAQTTDSHGFILELFKQWKAEQITNGNSVAQKDCTIDAVVNSDGDHPGNAIPDEFSVIYAKINDDDQLDALVLFNPIQCDGGNALMNSQTRLLILSVGSGYTIDDQYVDQQDQKYSKSVGAWGWFEISGARDGDLIGTYNQYLDTDARCCPSIEKKFRLNYATGKLTFFDE
jgi:hypothetical protein